MTYEEENKSIQDGIILPLGRETTCFTRVYWTLFAESLYKPAYCSNCMDRKSCDCVCREVAHILKGRSKEIDPCIE